MPQGFTVDNTRPMGNTHFDAPAPLWRNLGIFYKQPSFDGNNPFRLKNFAEAEGNDSIKYVADRPILFSTDSMPATLDVFEPGFIQVSGWDGTVLLFNGKQYWDCSMENITYLLHTFPVQDDIISRPIQFKYNPPYVRQAFWVSILTLLVSGGIMVVLDRKKT
jgi:hypothetical protein